uniref:Uncharacterized protein n=1 Tax=Octopus bimaculoides TaxID=37653 RepID=A0A0L8H2T5_OCTBM
MRYSFKYKMFLKGTIFYNKIIYTFSHNNSNISILNHLFILNRSSFSTPLSLSHIRTYTTLGAKEFCLYFTTMKQKRM